MAMKRYEAYCLTCCGGGKSLGFSSKRQQADTAAVGHMNAYGCNVTVVDRANVRKSA